MAMAPKSKYQVVSDSTVSGWEAGRMVFYGSVTGLDARDCGSVLRGWSVAFSAFLVSYTLKLPPTVSG